MTSKAFCCSLFQALILLLAIGAAESLNVIGNHRYASQRPLISSTSSSLSQKQSRANAMSNKFGCDESSSEETSSVDDLTRRNSGRVLFQSVLMAAVPWTSFRQSARAAADETVFFSGRVNLPSGMNEPGAGETSSSVDASTPPKKPALYVTARPNRPDNVPRAILDGSRGKPPPILAARFESPVFPFEFELGEKDLTPEGAGSDQSSFWWAADDLVVSARWDSDGVAATRSPEDLVGRTIWKKGTALAALDLEGRGAFGKFATKKN